MIAWHRRLPARAVLAALTGGLAGAAIALPFTNSTTPLLLLLPVAGSVTASAWWATREARTLRSAAHTATRALAGRSSSSRREDVGSEVAVLADAVQALVDRAEHSTRELSQRQAFAAMGDFATELAKELAPSVATARSSIAAIEKHIHLDSPLRPPLERAQRELHRLSNTLQDTLRLARSGRLASQRIDLWMPLRSALKTATQDANSYSIRVEAPPPGTAPIWVHGDHDALEQLFLNLLTNAVQATEAGGRIVLEVGVDAEATVSITDTGAGIPDGALDRVFEPFYTTKPEQAGLGLAIAWRTAAAHGGRLSIESTQGRGTSVEVSLPLADAALSYRIE